MKNQQQIPVSLPRQTAIQVLRQLVELSFPEGVDRLRKNPHAFRQGGHEKWEAHCQVVISFYEAMGLKDEDLLGVLEPQQTE